MMADIKELNNDFAVFGSPVEGGACFTSFSDTPTIPTDATTKLASTNGWESLGELSENGFTESKSIDVQKPKGWHGYIIKTKVSSEEESFKVEFLEVTRGAVAKLRYGKGNVTINEDGSYKSITAKNIGDVIVPLVFDEIEDTGYLRRTVIPKAHIESIDDVPHQKGNLMVYGMTLIAIRDADGAAYYVYRAKPATM